MHKKHFELIANILLAHTEQVMGTQDIKRRGTRGKANLQDLAVTFADVLAGENPRFNRQKFLEASGYYTLAD